MLPVPQDVDLPLLALYSSAHAQWRPFLELYFQQKEDPVKLRAVMARCKLLAQHVIANVGEVFVEPGADFLRAAMSPVSRRSLSLSRSSLSRSNSLIPLTPMRRMSSFGMPRLDSMRLLRDWVGLSKQWQLRYRLQSSSQSSGSGRPEVTAQVLDFVLDARVDVENLVSLMNHRCLCPE